MLKNVSYRPTKYELRKALISKMVDADMKKIFYKSMVLIVASKSLAIASPWFLKGVVDSMTVASQLSFGTAALGIAAFSGSRFLGELTHNYRMYMVMKMVQQGIRKISFDSFKHLHSLDLNFHKTSSKNTVFAINRALRSIESGLRFGLGFFTPVFIEFLLLCGMLQFYCGPKYLVNMLLTLGCYTAFSKTFSDKRRVQIRTRKDAEKTSEFYLNESIMNYETVKAFNAEKLENNRYETLLDKLRFTAIEVQKSLAQLNVGQVAIFTSGLTINLMMAAHEVCNGTMTPGDFVMISAYFSQLSGPLFNMGTLFREVAQSQVDMEDLFNMLQ